MSGRPSNSEELIQRLTPEMIEVVHRRMRELDDAPAETPLEMPVLRPLPIWNPILIIILVAGRVIVTSLNVILPRLLPTP